MEKVVLLNKEKLKEILEKMNEFKKIKIFEVLEDKEQTIKNKTALCDLLYQFETMKYLAIILYNTMKMSKDDLFNKEENFEKWQKLKGKYERIISNEPEKMKEALEGTKKFYKGMMTFSENCLKQRTGLMKAWDLANFSIKMDKSMLGLEYEYNKIKLKENVGESIEAMANIIKNGAVKIGMKAMYPSIEFRRKLYLKKKYAKIDRDLLYDIIQSVKENKPYELDINKIEDVYKKEEEKAKVPQDIYLKSIKKEFKPYYVSTRLISNSEIIFPKEERNFISAFFRPVGKGIEVRKKLMIYIHGGGFVGGTTFGEEKFLRDWSNSTGIPIIGIDYCIAPGNKYPESLNDCWQAYHWILENALENFAIDPQKIILAGDSAGGNLVLALTYLLIATNSKKLPDLLMALYPASDVSSATMSPSMVRSLDDVLLSTDSLFYINDAYRGNYETEEDPFLSPWRCNKFILEKLPKTRFFLADIDPLRDASIKLAAEIASIDKVDFKAYEFKGALHAFVESQEEVLKKLCNEVILGELQKFLEEQQ